MGCFLMRGQHYLKQLRLYLNHFYKNLHLNQKLSCYPAVGQHYGQNLQLHQKWLARHNFVETNQEKHLHFP